MVVRFKDFDVQFSAELLKESAGELNWNRLKLGYYNRTDTGVVTEMIFNNIKKKELLELSDMFAQLAEEANN